MRGLAERNKFPDLTVGIMLPSRGVDSMRSPTVVQHSIHLGGRKTSVTLEDAFWHGLKEIAHRRQMTLSD